MYMLWKKERSKVIVDATGNKDENGELCAIVDDCPCKKSTKEKSLVEKSEEIVIGKKGRCCPDVNFEVFFCPLK